MKYTELQEGTLVRCIQRVDEMIKNIRLATKHLESKEFEGKLERVSKLIRRDIVFSPSLYTVQEVVNVFDEEGDEDKGGMSSNATKPAMVVPPPQGEDNEADENLNDDLFNYNFEANSDALNEEEQFNANFI